MKYIATPGEFAGLMALSSEKIVVIDFTAVWCPPCKMIGPIFEAMAKDFPNAELVKIDVDDAQELSSQCGIRAMPTFQVYKDGAKVDEVTGASEQAVRAMIEKHYTA
jgi:thioredoxin